MPVVLWVWNLVCHIKRRT